MLGMKVAVRFCCSECGRYFGESYIDVYAFKTMSTGVMLDEHVVQYLPHGLLVENCRIVCFAHKSKGN